VEGLHTLKTALRNTQIVMHRRKSEFYPRRSINVVHVLQDTFFKQHAVHIIISESL